MSNFFDNNRYSSPKWEFNQLLKALQVNQYRKNIWESLAEVASDLNDVQARSAQILLDARELNRSQQQGEKLFNDNSKLLAILGVAVLLGIGCLGIARLFRNVDERRADSTGGSQLPRHTADETPHFSRGEVPPSSPVVTGAHYLILVVAADEIDPAFHRELRSKPPITPELAHRLARAAAWYWYGSESERKRLGIEDAFVREAAAGSGEWDNILVEIVMRRRDDRLASRSPEKGMMRDRAIQEIGGTDLGGRIVAVSQRLTSSDYPHAVFHKL